MSGEVRAIIVNLYGSKVLCSGCPLELASDADRQHPADTPWLWSAVYLALSLPPVVYPTRMAMNQWLPGDRTKKKIYRKVLLLIIIIGFSLAIAMSWCGDTQLPTCHTAPKTAPEGLEMDGNSCWALQAASRFG
jgi:hypothetical protein